MHLDSEIKTRTRLEATGEWESGRLDREVDPRRGAWRNWIEFEYILNLIKSRVGTTSRTSIRLSLHIPATVFGWQQSETESWIALILQESHTFVLGFCGSPKTVEFKNSVLIILQIEPYEIMNEILDRPAESTPRLRPWNVVSTRCPAWINDDSCMFNIYCINGVYIYMDYTSCCVPYIGWTGSSVFFSAIHWEFSSHSIYSLQPAILVPTTGQTWRVHSDHQLEPPKPRYKNVWRTSSPSHNRWKSPGKKVIERCKDLISVMFS